MSMFLLKKNSFCSRLFCKIDLRIEGALNPECSAGKALYGSMGRLQLVRCLYFLQKSPYIIGLYFKRDRAIEDAY